MMTARIEELASGPGLIRSAAKARAFALGGRAVFTLVSKKTAERLTYKVTKGSGGKPHWVKVLAPVRGEERWVFVGSIIEGRYRMGRNSAFGWEKPQQGAFKWFWQAMGLALMPDSLEVWHEGRCCVCGRALTVPQSIEDGIGPECKSKRGTWP